MSIRIIHSGDDKDEKCIHNCICELAKKREFEEPGFRRESDLKMEYLLEVPEENLGNPNNWKTV